MLAERTNFMGVSTEERPRFVGVRFHGECRTNPWEARCRADGRKHNLGYFATAGAAARAYDAFARQFPNRKLNFPDEVDVPVPLPSRAQACATVKRARPADSRPPLTVETHTAPIHFAVYDDGAEDLLDTVARRVYVDDEGDVTPTEPTVHPKRAKMLPPYDPYSAVRNAGATDLPTIALAAGELGAASDVGMRVPAGRRALHFALRACDADLAAGAPAADHVLVAAVCAKASPGSEGAHNGCADASEALFLAASSLLQLRAGA